MSSKRAFYEKAFNYNFAEDIPNWLKPLRAEEDAIIEEMMVKYHYRNSPLLDLGCGDGRILRLAKELNNQYKTKYTELIGADFINQPVNFPEYAKYIQCDFLFDSGKIEHFDFGNSISVGLSWDLRLEKYVYNLVNRISYTLPIGGFLIWQENKAWTLDGIRLRWSSPMRHYYHKVDKTFYVKEGRLEIVEKKATSISRIYAMQRIY